MTRIPLGQKKWPHDLETKKMTKITIKSKIDQNTPWNLYLQDQNDNKNAIQPLYLLDLKPINFKINRFKMPWCEIYREVVFEEKRKRIVEACKGSIERTTSGPETQEEEKVMGSDSIYFGNLKRAGHWDKRRKSWHKGGAPYSKTPHHHIKCPLPVALATLMRIRPLNSASLASKITVTFRQARCTKISN